MGLRSLCTMRTFPMTRSLLLRQCSTTQEGLHITPECASAIHRKSQGGKKFLRLGLTIGCHGYMYEYKITDDLNEKADRIFEKDGARVVVQQDFLPVLRGSTVDFEVEMEREGFKILDNPQAKSSCGCARSFTPEQYNKL